MMKSVFIAIAGAAALCVALPASAEVRMERVRFTSNGDEIQGDLYIPDSVTSKKPGPAVVVTGAWMTVKEQMPARYAREMAQRGFVALAFDFRGWGQSGGERRQFEDPSAKIADIRAAVEYLKTRPEIAADAIGGLGVCASSGYMVTAAASTPLIRSVALVAPWLHDREILEETYGGREGVEKLTAAGGAAEAANKKSGRQSFVPAASLTDKTAIMFGVPYYTERDRGLIPAWRNEADPGFWPGWLGFDAVQAAPAVTQPFLMVHSEAAAIPNGAHRFYARLTSPKSELWLDNVSQFDFYDQPVPVTRASDAAAAHFRKTLLNDTEKQRRDGLASAGVREFFAPSKPSTSPGSCVSGPTTASRTCRSLPEHFRSASKGRRRSSGSTARCRPLSPACDSPSAGWSRPTNRVWSSPSMTGASDSSPAGATTTVTWVRSNSTPKESSRISPSTSIH